MSGSTTRLSLYKMGGGLSGLYPPDEQANVDKINENSDKIDDAIGAKNVSSTTRPPAPFDGQIIKESDTGRAMVWQASITTWVELMPGGVMAGNTALRDLLFPTPGTPAGRVTLANTYPRFFNKDKGYEQQYFAQFDDAGVGTAPAKTVHGWGAAMHLGLVPLKPTSVAVGSGTGVLHGGKVEYAGASSVSLNGIFSADFTNYEVIIDNDTAAGDAGVTMRMRVAGVDLSTSTYDINQIENTNGGVLGGGVPGSATSAVIGRIASIADSAQRFTVTSPFVTRRTNIFGHSMDATLFQRLFGNVVRNLISYDGFTIIFGTTATGRVRVYGINDY